MFKLRRKVLLLLLIVLLALTVTPVKASEIALQGELVDGRFLVPMRSIFENLGASVDWDGATRTVTGLKGDISVKLTLDHKLALVNGESLELDVPASIINGRTFVPTRFVSESLGADVSWDGGNRVATITSAGTVIKVYEEKQPLEPVLPPVAKEQITLDYSPTFIPAGGGQTVTFNISVSDDGGNPVEEAVVHVIANAAVEYNLNLPEEKRIQQLSATEITTDASGSAAVTYKTLPGDDNRQVVVCFTVNVEDEWFEQRLNFVASNQGAKVEGVVMDPFSGASRAGISINFGNDNTGRAYNVRTDATGRYTIVLPTGNYTLDFFDIGIGDSVADIRHEYTGSHHNVAQAKITWSSFHANISSAGTSYTVNYDKGILRGVIANARAGQTLAVIRNGVPHRSGTVLVNLASDGSFVVPLRPGSYDILIMGRSNPFKTGITVKSTQVNDLGSINAY